MQIHYTYTPMERRLIAAYNAGHLTYRELNDAIYMYLSLWLLD